MDGKKYTYPASFLYENMMIEANLIHAAWKVGVEKLVFLGSTCIYPKLAPQPMPESSLLTGSLEPTNEWYAIAKIAGIKLCQAYRKQYGCDFIAAQPTNLYGPGDNYDLENSHVNYSGEEHVNVGSGDEVSIRGLAELICETVGFSGELVFDASKPDGTPRKLCDVTKLKELGWDNARSLKQGVSEVYHDAF